MRIGAKQLNKCKVCQVKDSGLNLTKYRLYSQSMWFYTLVMYPNLALDPLKWNEVLIIKVKEQDHTSLFYLSHNTNHLPPGESKPLFLLFVSVLTTLSHQTVLLSSVPPQKGCIPTKSGDHAALLIYLNEACLFLLWWSEPQRLPKRNAADSGEKSWTQLSFSATAGCVTVRQPIM